MSNKKQRLLIALLVLLTFGLIGNSVVILNLQKQLNPYNISNTVQESIEISDSTTQVVAKVKASVVTIVTEYSNGQTAIGSGSVISKDGTLVKIVTNNHVVDKGKTIKVIFSNKKEVTAKVLGKDAISDLALLEATIDFDVTPLTFGDSDVLQQGESVIAIGSPLDLEFTGTVTKGVVSGLNRSIEVDTNSDNVADYNMNVLQTDTTINPGNSGGPLINMAGQIVGINTSKISETGFEGMGFSIPSNEAKAILVQLEEKGSVERPKLGISYIPMEYLASDTGFYSANNIDTSVKSGLYIKNVEKNSKADQAGLKANDIIIKFNDVETKTASQFTTKLYSKKAGDTIKLTVIRNKKEEVITIKL